MVVKGHIIQAYFDGRVFVPKEPVDLVPETSVALTVEAVHDRGDLPAISIEEQRKRLHSITGIVSVPGVSAEFITHEDLYEDP